MCYYNFYFSPTGGTKRVADAVAAGWGEPFKSVDLMKSEKQESFTSEDICLFAVPSYGGRVPTSAVEALRKLSGNGASAILIAVFGNRAIDDTLLELSDELEKAGFRCIAAMEAVAQHSLLPQYGAGRPDDHDLAELKSFAQKIKTAVEESKLSEKLSLPGNHPYREYNGVPLKPSASKDCSGCGRCAAECPTGAISSQNFRVTDKNRCISCMHCVAICPKHARKVNKLMYFVASQKMKKSCSGRKDNKLYL